MSFSPELDILRSLDLNGRINDVVIGAIDDSVWLQPRPIGRGRTIGATFAHLHKARTMWLSVLRPKLSHVTCEPKTVTRSEASNCLHASGAALREVVAASLATDGRIKGFPAGAVAFASYIVAHEAHHRGQAILLAKMLGMPVDKDVQYGIWDMYRLAHT